MVSRRTAELALRALLELSARSRLNGGMTLAQRDEIKAAVLELDAVAHLAADGNELAGQSAVVAPFEVIDTAEAARRLRLPERTVRHQLTKGRLAGRKVGRQWVVEWRREIAA